MDNRGEPYVPMNESEKSSIHSSFRENMIEHLFIGELLKLSWKEDCSLEIARSEVDNGGYDLIAELNGIVRHIQLKASSTVAATSRQSVNINLARKRSGCIVWILYDEKTLALKSFRFFGGKPGESLPDLSKASIAKHTKGNSAGVKNERPNIRSITVANFEEISNVVELYRKLFGETHRTVP
jgi:hypothetical protein